MYIKIKILNTQMNWKDKKNSRNCDEFIQQKSLGAQ